MVFKRRHKQSTAQQVLRAFWPRGGWVRAFKYMRIRLKRLPDSPRKISRGLAFGIFAVFTPFYGLHFVISYLFARFFNGNVIAALLATVAGNPFTYVPIGVVSLKTGHFILGTEFDHEKSRSFVGKSFDALRELLGNLRASVSGGEVHWDGLARFANEIFWPYLVGGTLVGIFAALAVQYLTYPVIAAYQIRRRKKIEQRRAQAPSQ